MLLSFYWKSNTEHNFQTNPYCFNESGEIFFVVVVVVVVVVPVPGPVPVVVDVVVVVSLVSQRGARVCWLSW